MEYPFADSRMMKGLLRQEGFAAGRLKSEASFAALCGVSPVPASSGKTIRHRLNRGGDRAANSAIHIIAIGRLRLDPCTQAYVAKRIAAGNSKLEAIRSLKRYIALEVFGIIMRRQKQINQFQIAVWLLEGRPEITAHVHRLRQDAERRQHPDQHGR